MSALSQFFGGSIKRIQRGTITMGGASTTVTITLPFAVDPTKSVLNLNGTSTSSVSGQPDLNRFFYVQLTDGGTTLTGTAAWQIVEYN